MIRSSLLLASLLLPAAALAVPETVREVTLNDGRVFYGEVVTTEPSGVRLRVPQGDMVVPFHQLQNMQPSFPERYGRQPPWEVIVVGPDAERGWIERAVRTLPEVYVSGDQGKPSGVSTSMRKAAQACPPADLGCAVSAARRDGSWQWIVTVEPGDRGSATLRARTTTDGGGGMLKVDDLSDPAAVLAGIDRLFGLREVPERNRAITSISPYAPKPAGKDRGRTKTPKSPRVASASSAPFDSFVPVPGYSSLKNGDMRGFGMAMAVTLPATAAWVGVTGSQSQSSTEHIAMSAGGFYLTTVVVNQVFGASGSGPALALTPTPAGRGPQLGLSVPLK